MTPSALSPDIDQTALGKCSSDWEPFRPLIFGSRFLVLPRGTKVERRAVVIEGGGGASTKEKAELPNGHIEMPAAKVPDRWLQAPFITPNRFLRLPKTLAGKSAGGETDLKPKNVPPPLSPLTKCHKPIDEGSTDPKPNGPSTSAKSITAPPPTTAQSSPSTSESQPLASPVEVSHPTTADPTSTPSKKSKKNKKKKKSKKKTTDAESVSSDESVPSTAEAKAATPAENDQIKSPTFAAKEDASILTKSTSSSPSPAPITPISVTAPAPKLLSPSESKLKDTPQVVADKQPIKVPPPPAAPSAPISPAKIVPFSPAHVTKSAPPLESKSTEPQNKSKTPPTLTPSRVAPPPPLPITPFSPVNKNVPSTSLVKKVEPMTVVNINATIKPANAAPKEPIKLSQKPSEVVNGTSLQKVFTMASPILVAKSTPLQPVVKLSKAATKSESPKNEQLKVSLPSKGPAAKAIDSQPPSAAKQPAKPVQVPPPSKVTNDIFLSAKMSVASQTQATTAPKAVLEPALQKSAAKAKAASHNAYASKGDLPASATISEPVKSLPLPKQPEPQQSTPTLISHSPPSVPAPKTINLFSITPKQPPPFSVISPERSSSAMNLPLPSSMPMPVNENKKVSSEPELPRPSELPELPPIPQQWLDLAKSTKLAKKKKKKKSQASEEPQKPVWTISSSPAKASSTPNRSFDPTIRRPQRPPGAYKSPLLNEVVINGPARNSVLEAQLRPFPSYNSMPTTAMPPQPFLGGQLPGMPPMGNIPTPFPPILAPFATATLMPTYAGDLGLLQQHRQVLNRLRADLMGSTRSIAEIASTFHPERHIIATIIAHYFEYLVARLADPTVTYLTLINAKEYHFHDFFAYGIRFGEFLLNSKWFPVQQVETYFYLEHKYRNLYPARLLDLRMELIAAKAEIFSKRRDLKEVNSLEGQIKLEMVTYRPVDVREIVLAIQTRPTAAEQLHCFLTINQNAHAVQKLQLDQLNGCLQASLKNPNFRTLYQLLPRLHPFGSLINSLGSVESDLDLIVRYEKYADVDLLDYETAVLGLEVVERALQRMMAIPPNGSKIIRSRRCPIIQLDFEASYKKLKPGSNNAVYRWNKCDISGSALYGVKNSNLLRFFATLEPRFRQMTQLLKYWAKRNQLINTECFSSYAFTMKIIFYLQCLRPPVLPSIQFLQELERKRGIEERIHHYNFAFSTDQAAIGPRLNKASVGQLVVGFFTFYSRFDYSKDAICPRYGQKTSKEQLYQEKILAGLDFGNQTYLCIEDPFVLDHNVGAIFRMEHWSRWTNLRNRVQTRMNENNYVTVLTDPSLFSNAPPGLEPGSMAKMVTMVYNEGSWRG